MDAHPSVDYFWLLEDALLLTVLSFLPFRDAVRTSVLSKRWQSLWHCTRNIDLDQRQFGRSAASQANFSSFIHRWMEVFREPEAERFRLAFSDPPEPYLPFLRQCISFAISRRVKTLEVDFRDPDLQEGLVNPPAVVLIPVVFDSNSVPETLSLSACGFTVSGSNRFLGLKNLFLGWLEMPGHSINEILAVCPFLETLILRRCWNVDNIMQIKSESLQFLAIDKCVRMQSQFVSVEAPLLKIFKYFGLPIHLQLHNHERLQEVVIDFEIQLDLDEETHTEIIYNLIDEINGIRSLTICSYTLQILPKAGNLLMLKPSLAGITNLCLTTQLNIQEYYGISFFLNSCPKLELLSIDLSDRIIFEEYEAPYQLKRHPFVTHKWHPACLEKSLKRLKVRGFKGVDADEVRALAYLVKFGKVLEKLMIVVEEMYRKNIQKLAQFGVGSPRLQLFVSSAN